MSESIFMTHRFEIPFDFGEEISIFPLGDIHRFAPMCDSTEWLNTLERIRATKNAYILGMGDYDDFTSASERHAIKVSQLHDSTLTTLSDLAKSRIYEFADEIAFMKGRVIGLLEGNHHFEFLSGVTSTHLLCEYLNCKYLGGTSLLRLDLKHRRSGKSMCVDIFAKHGSGAGRWCGSSITKVEQAVTQFGADIYLMAHDHRDVVARVVRLELGTKNEEAFFKSKEIICARTGNYLKGYVDGEQSYQVKQGYPPAHIGCNEIQIIPLRDRKIVDGKKQDRLYFKLKAIV